MASNTENTNVISNFELATNLFHSTFGGICTFSDDALDVAGVVPQMAQ
jgi:hypothetical protein